MSRKFTVAFFAILVGGCASIGSYQAECEKRSEAFAEIVQCLKASVASDSRPGMSKDARVKLYLLKADQLSQKVQSKEISELDAKVALQELYVRLKRDKNADIDSILASMPKTTRTNCTAYGNNVNCISR